MLPKSAIRRPLLAGCNVLAGVLLSASVSGVKSVVGKRLRSYVLTRFQWFHTFVPSNPNVSKDGDKRNGHISSSRKTV